jgi:molecular chaperone GrpE
VTDERRVEEQAEERAEEQAEEVDELAAVTRERDEYLDALQRLKAEFDNYRKRALRDQEALVVRAHERLVKELLPVLDDLGRAAEPPVGGSGPGEGNRGNREVPPAADRETRFERLLEGVRLVHRALADVLQREGLAEIDTNGRFDPHVHEALLSQPSEADEGTVIEVVQKGYRLGDRVLRPARVVVAAPAAQPPVRESGPGEGARGNREVPPTDHEDQGGDAE